MTISSTTVVTRTNTNGTTHTFSFGHPFQDPDDLLVYLVTIADWSIALQARDTNYTVSSTGDEDEVGGTITFINELQVATAPATGKVCVILRKPPLEQDYNPSTVYEAAQGEAALDRVYQALQYLQFRAGRSIHLNDAYADATVEIPDATARASKALVFDSSGNLTVGVTGASVLTGAEAAQTAAEAAATAASGYASTATGAATDATTAKDLAEAWATKVNGLVDGTDYSSKAWAIGGTDVSQTAERGAAKEWAIRTEGLVDTDEGSAKSYAVGGTGVSGTADRGSAKEWATKTDGSPATAEYSAKAYAVGGTGVSGGDGAAKEWADKTDGAVNGGGDAFSAKAWANGGTSVTMTADRGSAKDWAVKTDGNVDTADASAKAYAIGGTGVSETAGRGAAKEWATKTDGNVDTADASAKAWAIGGTDVDDTAGRGSAKDWATKAEDSTVDGSGYSAFHWAQKAEDQYQAAAAVSENPALTFTFDATTTDSDPGDGNFRINHATYASATFVYLDNEDYFGNAMTGWLDFFDDATSASKGLLMIRDVTDPLAFAIYRVTGSVVDGTGYRKIPVSAVTTGSGTFSGTTSVMFIPAPDPTAVVLSNTGLKIYDTGGDHTLGIVFNENAAADRTLNLVMGASNRSLTFEGDVIVSQDYSTDASPQFTGINLGHVSDTPITRVATGRIAVAGDELAQLPDLASTSNGLGAALIGIQDAGGYFPGDDVEAALQALGQSIAALDQAIVLKGDWDASAGSFPGSGSAPAGWKYIVSVAGTVDGVAFAQNDTIVAITDNASTSTYAGNWFKQDFTDQVLSVAGKQGAVTLDSADITDFTEASQDIAGGLLVASEGTGDLDWTYADATPALSAVIKDEAVTFAKMQHVATNSLLGRDASGTGDVENILLNSTLEMDGSGNLQRAALTGAVTASAGSNTTTTTIDIALVIGDGINDITTSPAVKGYFPLDFAGNVTGWTLIGDASGSIVLDVWKAAGAAPTNSDSITGTDKPTLSTAQYATDSSITWTSSGAFSAGDVLAIEVEGATTVKQVTLVLKVTKTS